MKSSVQIDNNRVRVTHWTLPVGDDTGEHRREYQYVVVPLATGRMGITDSDGAESTAELSPGVCYYRESGAQHTVRNDGDDVLEFVEVEVLDGKG